MQSGRVVAMFAQYWPESTLLPKIAGRVAFAYRLGGEDAADLLQEVRVAVLEQSPVELLSAGWIFQVARNKAINILRRRCRDREISEQSSDRASGVDGEIVRLVRAQVSLLPERQRQFYELRYRRGMTEREVAKRLDVCRSSVRYLDRLVRGRLGESLASKTERGPKARKAS